MRGTGRRRLAAAAVWGVAMIGLGAGCGEDHDHGDPAGITEPVVAGFFGGTTGRSEPMSLQVGDDVVWTVQISCGGPDRTVFDFVDVPIDDEGVFALQTFAGRLPLGVSGIFFDQNRVEGVIDGDPLCAGEFRLRRCSHPDPACVVSTPSPTPSSTATPTPTATPTATPEFAAGESR